MSDVPKFFNPNESKKPTQTDEKPKKKAKKEKKAKLKKEQSTRSIRFVKRGVQNYITYFFWCILFMMILFVGISYARFGVVLAKINQKEIDPQEIVTDIKNSNELENKAKYESRLFLEQLFTYNADNKDSTDARSDYLSSQLATGLTESMLISNSNKTKQNVTSIVFVDDKLVSKDKEQYSFTYDVTVETSSESEDTSPKSENFQISLPVSIQNGDFKVINYPTYLNVEPSDNAGKNDSYYQEKDYLTKGDKLDSDQKKALESFTQDFFKLYATNDDSLKLISNVKGLNDAELKNVTVKNIVKNDKYFIVEGTFSVSYDKTSDVTSFFSLEINKTNDTYFVVTLK